MLPEGGIATAVPPMEIVPLPMLGLPAVGCCVIADVPRIKSHVTTADNACALPAIETIEVVMSGPTS